MTPETAIAELKALGNPSKAAEMATYHKVSRTYLGVSNPELDRLAKGWRTILNVEERVATSAALWRTDGHEGRILAAKLLTQARLRPSDVSAWELIRSWVSDFDAWAIADHACMAGAKRLIWEPSRLAEIEHWHRSEHMWTRRAALVITLPWTKQNNPKPEELAVRDQVLGWAATYVEDPEWFLQKAVAWWLRELSKHDAERVRDFLEEFGARMKPFARKEAARKLD
ncbi:MAG: DNA alkylation repair protein [Pseudomonadota bacterium]